MATTFSGGTGTSVSGQSSTGYPVQVTIQYPQNPSKFFAIPVIGYIARAVMSIPHLIALYIVGGINGLIHLAAWAPVLFGGRYPDWAYNWTTGTLRWSTRVGAYFFGLTDQYPPFGLGSNDDGYPVQVAFQYPQNPSKFFAIPVIGYVARLVMLIPHLIALYIVGAINGLIHLAAWAPVLFGGQYPDWAYNWSTGTLRWGVRVAAYLYGLSDQYPPFGLSE